MQAPILTLSRSVAPILLALAALAGPEAHAQVAAAASAASAPGHWGHGLRWLKAVGATAAQQSSIQAILASVHTQVTALRTAAGDPRLKLQQVLGAATVDATAAATAEQQIQALQASIGNVMLQAQLQIANVLTATQRAELLAWQQAHHDHPGPRPGRG